MTPVLSRGVAARLDPFMPFADGICFDDCFALAAGTVAMLRGRGLVWLTRLCIDNPGEEYRYPAGYVIAADRRDAELIADARGLGETVLGCWEAS
ncbi:hypothetical protein [Ancylobacter defluvii]|uniref:Uncharacterized protein n=1 Tax=Ancylobacter defluvii TaxID=1282440 RepID=A0A9W6JYX3_9HYPH|nr:hypothetical protein [Ancylobacter defluvii]MBS7586431.1 hypothetical protein [Ancylobacter defluvii]GLK85712.1 hypothetical protein GCM10017653_37820 [Ancylobacter defluvii]